MIRFYSPELEDTGVLPEEESMHCCRVLRMKNGDSINVIDGKGKCYTCEIIEANPKQTRVRILSSVTEPVNKKGKIVLAIAPTKNIDRIEWLIEKVVELGIDEIMLLECVHSERRKVNYERLNRIVISAMKQSLKSRKPELSDIITFKKFIESVNTECKVMGYCDKNCKRTPFTSVYKGNKDITILIGPEGDFSPEEVDLALKQGFIPVTFGDVRLRTETAGLYAVTAVHVIDSLKDV